MGKKRKTVEIGLGSKCVKCRKQMTRFEHGPSWKPKPMQPYYFKYWDKCSCGMLQHYEAAKVPLAEENIDGNYLDTEYRNIMQGS